MTILLIARLSAFFTRCMPFVKKKPNRPAARNRKNNRENREISSNNIRRKDSTGKYGRRMSSKRVSRVISEIHDFGFRDKKELIDGIKAQAKELALFFALFVIYVLFGAFLFFYIEECSGATMADDNSTPSLTDTLEEVTFKNITETCILLSVESRVKNISSMTLLNTTIYKTFLNKCETILKSATNPFTSQQGYKTKCVVDEFQMLKYAEYTIFTLLTVGYGNTTPVTIIGRYVLIVYAIFGVPIAVSMYSVAGKLLAQCFTFIISYFELEILKRSSSEKILKLKVLIFSIVVMLCIMLLGCSVTMRSDMENWEFSSSIYFWFVSLTTIGYGDLHFERNRHLASIHFLLISAGNLLFGLGISAAIIEAFAMALEKRELIMNSDDEEDEENTTPTSTVEGSTHTIEDSLRTVEESNHTLERSLEFRNGVRGNIANELASPDSSVEVSNVSENLVSALGSTMKTTKSINRTVTFYNAYTLDDEPDDFRDNRNCTTNDKNEDSNDSVITTRVQNFNLVDYNEEGESENANDNYFHVDNRI